MPRHLDHLSLSGIDRRFPDRAVLRDVSLSVPPGERLALVGENGSGKTTLLRIAAGLDRPDAGRVHRPASLRLVHQELEFPRDATVRDVLDAATADAQRVARELDEAAHALGWVEPGSSEGRIIAREYDRTLALATAMDVWAVDARVDRSLAGLGLAEVAHAHAVGQLSGGQRTRLALAAALVARPVALLLDEPTNHLDAGGLDFLTEELRGWSGPVLFASHDRTFLDDVATRIVDLDPVMGVHRPDQSRDLVGEQGRAYRGGYSDYRQVKTLERRRWEEQHAREQDELTRLRQEVGVGARDVFHSREPKTEVRAAKKFYSDKASTTIARRVRSARERLSRLEREQVARPPEPLHFSGFTGFTLSARTSTAATVATLNGVAVAGRMARTSLDIRSGARVLVTGPNGAGKSTLLGVLSGRVDPTSGTRHLGAQVRVGELHQDVRWSDPAMPVLRAGANPDPDAVAAALTATGLVAPRDLHRPVGALSLGQQRRLELAALVLDPPDVLLLDEPSNHLSLSLVEELEAALQEYPGAVLIASHDRWLRATLRAGSSPWQECALTGPECHREP